MAVCAEIILNRRTIGIFIEGEINPIWNMSLGMTIRAFIIGRYSDMFWGIGKSSKTTTFVTFYAFNISPIMLIVTC